MYLCKECQKLPLKKGESVDSFPSSMTHFICSKCNRKFAIKKEGIKQIQQERLTG